MKGWIAVTLAGLALSCTQPEETTPRRVPAVVEEATVTTRGEPGDLLSNSVDHTRDQLRLLREELRNTDLRPKEKENQRFEILALRMELKSLLAQD